MSEPLMFSIVIPTYNREKFVEATLESVFAQTYPNYEVICVDNCSTDNTANILRRYAELGKITFIQHDKNYERARSRNTGMEAAKGDFLTFLDSDDFMYPNNLADAAAFAKNNPEIKCFHSLYELVTADRKAIYKYKFPPLNDQLRAIADGNFMSCIGNFIHREIYSKYKFDTSPDLTGGEDWEFWLRVLADHKLGRIEKINSGIQHHDGRSVNNQNIESMQRGLSYLAQKFRGDPHLSQVYGKYLNRIEASSFFYLNVLANDGRLNKLAFDFLRTAVEKEKSVLFSMRFMRSLRRTVMNSL
jgi:glycosyltransferase involved in cell wall biosynthesis